MQAETKKVYNLLGLAQKSRNLVSGSFMTEKTIKDGKARLVIVSADASGNTKKMFGDKCTHYKVPLYIYGESMEMGHALGKEARVSLAVTDSGFAKAIIKHLERQQ
ncbi:MAG: ribosomal L7Ae/L30e/S12e/Gadd45 family protein [Lachnospiraceae bacterium]|jgi:ribosomal protein L7Ae-like RNA K-turn-binding protein|nr:ribosomal L7Ae/L30e/S12e/Gadd45 family protein [Lachnospiraceae bacterium]